MARIGVQAGLPYLVESGLSTVKESKIHDLSQDDVVSLIIQGPAQEDKLRLQLTFPAALMIMLISGKITEVVATIQHVQMG